MNAFREIPCLRHWYFYTRSQVTRGYYTCQKTVFPQWHKLSLEYNLPEYLFEIASNIIVCIEFYSPIKQKHSQLRPELSCQCLPVNESFVHRHAVTI